MLPNSEPPRAEIGKRLGRKALEEVAQIVRPETILGWYRELIARKFDGSNAHRIGYITNAIFSDQQIHTAKVAYVPGALRIFLDDLENPSLSVPLNLAAVMSLDEGRAWVGFTSSTGGDCQNHDLLSWSFASLNYPVTQAAQPVAAASSPPQKPLTAAPAFAATQPSPALPPDRAFSAALPAQVGLTHRIEASTDLVHWVTITNAALYFKDYKSTNYDRRFYRFPER